MVGFIVRQRTKELPVITGGLQSLFSGGRSPSADLARTGQQTARSHSFPGLVWEPGSPSNVQSVLFQGLIHLMGPKELHLTYTKAMLLSHREICERNTLAPNSCQVTLPSGHLYTLKAKGLKKWLQGGGMAAKEPGDNEYALVLNTLQRCSRLALQRWSEAEVPSRTAHLSASLAAS